MRNGPHQGREIKQFSWQKLPISISIGRVGIGGGHIYEGDIHLSINVRIDQ